MSNENKQSISVSYERTNNVPLDSTTVFSTFAEADAYVTSEPTTAYEGQLITVSNSSITYKVYKNAEGKLDLEDVCYDTFAKLKYMDLDKIYVVKKGVTEIRQQDYFDRPVVILPTTVTTFEDGSFTNCHDLLYINIPERVMSIGEEAFFNCSGLTSITIPDSVTSIGPSAFRGCNGLTSITIPFVGATKNGTSNTHFGYIFGAPSYTSEYVPTSLKTVVITGGTSISDFAFYNCSRLTSITIPNSVTSIGDGAFADCIKLTSINYNGTMAQWNSVTKAVAWASGATATYVQCTDGQVTI